MTQEEAADTSTSISWWARVAPRLRRAERCALFLDFDGTLADLTTEPDQARLPEETRQLLRTLARRPRARLFFISGRRRGDLRKRVRLRGCEYLGLFGSERAGWAEPACAAAIRRLRAEADAAVSDLPGVWVEDKGIAFVVHYRDATSTVRALARRRVRHLVRSATSVRQLESAHGLEVVPRDVTDKGVAVRQLLREKDLRAAVPVYLGDDVSDEAGFRAARRGVTIKVGAARQTAARYRLAGPREVRELLGLLAQALR